MSNASEAAEMAGQLRKYADSIAAFCVLQGVAFCFALANSVEMVSGVKECPVLVYVLLLAATGAYVFGVSQCHKGEDELAGTPDKGTTLGKWNRKIRFGRFLVIVLSAVLSLIAMGGKTKMNPFSCPVCRSPADIRPT